jgi:WD40 repeat protein
MPESWSASNRDGKRWALPLRNGSVGIFDQRGNMLRETFAGIHSNIAAIDPSGNLVAIVRTRQILLDDVKRPSQTIELGGHRREPTSLHFSSDSKWLLSIARPPKDPEGEAILWNLSQPGSFHRLNANCIAGAWEPNGSRVAIACPDGQILIYELDAKKCIARGREILDRRSHGQDH